MKKLLVLAAALFAFAAQAQHSVSYDVGTARDYRTQAKSSVQYTRGNIDVGNGYSVGLLSRTQRYSADQAVVGATEGVVKKAIGNGYVGIGAGYDAGPAVSYSIVTAGYFLPVGATGAGAFTGIQVNTHPTKRHHQIAWLGYSIPVTKNVTFNPTVARNYGDFTENEVTLGLAYTF